VRLNRRACGQQSMPTPNLDALARNWLIALFILWGSLLFGGFVFSSNPASSQYEIPTAAKMASSLVLVVAGWSWCLFLRSCDLRTYALLIATGMSFGFVGDLCMAGLLPIGNTVLGGMASFGIGHIVYLAALMHVARVVGCSTPAPWKLAWGSWLLVGVVGWYFVVYRNVHDASLVPAALGYVLLLASVAGCASELAVQSRSFLPMACGTALFFVSDLMIALNRFADLNSSSIEAAIWLTYGPAQMLIVYSVISLRTGRAAYLASTDRAKHVNR